MVSQAVSNGNKNGADQNANDEAVSLQLAKELVDSKHPLNIEGLLVSFCKYVLIYQICLGCNHCYTS